MPHSSNVFAQWVTTRGEKKRAKARLAHPGNKHTLAQTYLGSVLMERGDGKTLPPFWQKERCDAFWECVAPVYYLREAAGKLFAERISPRLGKADEIAFHALYKEQGYFLRLV